MTTKLTALTPCHGDQACALGHFWTDASGFAGGILHEKFQTFQFINTRKFDAQF